MLDLLACPIDKHYPLELFEINIKREDNNNDDIIISEGILFCAKCHRFCHTVTECHRGRWRQLFCHCGKLGRVGHEPGRRVDRRN